MHRTLDLGKVRVGIRSTSATFGGWLDEALGRYMVPGESDPHYSVVLPDDGAAPGRKLNILYKGTISLVRTFDLRTLARVFIAELESLSFPEREDAVYLNAGVARTRDRTALIQASLVHHLVRLRRQLERAELVLSPIQTVGIDAGSGQIVPVRGELRVPPEVLDRLPTAHHPASGPSDRLFVERPLDVDVVCWLADVEAPLLEPMSRGMALHHLTAQAMNLSRLGGKALRGLARVVEGARCYGLGGDDARDMSEALARTLIEDVPTSA